MADNLFEVDPTLPALDPSKDYFSELVGEGKKFKDEKALARGKYEADQTIEHFKKIQDEMRKDLLEAQAREKAGATLQEIYDRLDKSQKTNSEHTSSTQNVNTNPTSLTPDEVKNLSRKEYLQLMAEQKEKENFDKVQVKLRERLGPNFQTTLNEQREALGLTTDEINAMAKRSPEVFFRTFGLNQQQQQDNFNAPPRNTQRSDSFAPRTEKRTWSWYQELKKKDPKAYWDPKTVTQRLRDAQDLGPAFDDGDANYWDRLGNPTYDKQ